MTWQRHNILVSSHFWNQNPPKRVIGPTKYRAKHICSSDKPIQVKRPKSSWLMTVNLYV